MRPVLETDHLEERFARIVRNAPWRAIEQAFARAESILLLGNGGNLLVAQHMAMDIERMTGKRADAPANAGSVSGLSQDHGPVEWMARWVRPRLGHPSSTLVLGLSASGDSPNVERAIAAAHAAGASTAIIYGRSPPSEPPGLHVVLSTRYYHSTETLYLLLAYQLIRSVGQRPRALPGVEVIPSNWETTERETIAVDFDGVIHDRTGFGDGRALGTPVAGSLVGLRFLSQRFRVIIYTSKARSDRPLVDGASGPELVWAWLAEHGVADCVADVTAEKPRAALFIDDRAVRFDTWEAVLRELE